MPLFAKRRGSSAQPVHTPELPSRNNANPSQPVNRAPSVGATAAAAAAGSAYMNKSSGSGSLSSAAAAAALRSHTTTPEPVGSIQTKRMVRRGSVSSVASGSVVGATPTRAGLQRRDSGGSMTERTFRSPSQSPSRANARSPEPVVRPPVPQIPKTLRSGPGRRASSTEPPERVMSPTLRSGNRSASVDRVNLQQQQRLSNVPETDDLARRSSVNFSRPRFSPEPQETNLTRSGSRTGWFAGPTGSIPEAANENPSINQAIANATSRPSRATSLPPVQTKQETEAVMVYDPNTRRFVQATRPKPVKQEEPPSPIVDAAPKLKPGDFDPATRSIVPGLAKTQPASAAELEPPPRNPARLSPNSSPVITPQRPSGLLHKQPSMVREDPIAEQEAEDAASPIAPRFVSNQQSAASKSYASPARSHQRSTSLDVPRAADDPRGRDVSLSPSRSTRFSTATVLGGVRHEPQRGVSPVKSAMKHSPSSSIRTASPVATFSPLALAQNAASDVSDTTSLTSADGLSSSGKKRRSVRVSFDDEATEPVPPLPEAKVAALTAKDKPVVPSDVVSDEDGDEMTPRPALPSFGSVRRNRVQNEVAEKVTESSPDRGRVTPDQPAAIATAKAAEIPAPPTVASTETAPAAKVSAPPAATSPPTAPAATIEPEKAIPAIVTSQAPSPEPVLAEKSTAAPVIIPGINLHPPTPGLSTSFKDNASDDGNVSDRSDQRAIKNLAQGVIFYGDESDDSRSRQMKPSSPVRTDSDDNEFVDAAEAPSPVQQAGFASINAIVETPVSSPTKTAAPANALSVDSDKANASQASTAGAQEPTSPATPTSPSDWSAAGSYWSKINKQSKANADKEKGQLSSDDEKPAKRSFFKRNKDKKTKDKSDAPSSPPKVQNSGLPIVDNSLATAAPPVFASDTTAPSDVPQTTAPPDAPTTAPETASAPTTAPANAQVSTNQPAAAPKAAAAPTPATTQPPALQPSPVITSTSKSASGPANTQAKPIKSALKKTAPVAVASEDEGKRMPRTMRGSGAPQQSRSNAAPATRQRPVSAAPVVASQPLAQRASKIINDDSESDSSFKKKRKGASSVDSDGRYNMRRSMRAGSVSSQQRAPLTNGNRASSVRATSPASSTKAPEFRHSMRGPPNSRSLRTSSAGPAQRNSYAGQTSMTARLKSRFADSDDEDTGSRQTSRPFRSRFADSDEEDDTIAEELPPVRGIPRRHGQEDGDSTDLEDESDLASPPNSPPRRRRNKKITPDESEIEKAMDAARRKLGLQPPSSAPTGEGAALGKGTLRDRENDKVLIPADMMSEGSSASGTRRKRGLMGLLRRNKSDNQGPASPGVQSPLSQTGTIPEEPQQETAPASPPAKLTRRLSSQPERQKLTRGNSALSTATAPAASSTRPADNEHWPLPPPIPQERMASFRDRKSERPTTSDEEPTQELERPSNRRSFSARVGFTREAIAHSERGDSVQGDEDQVVSQRTGKKKRFGLLRRAFGLYD